MNQNIFYFNTLNSIGGIESFFYQLGIKYGKDFDITVYYRSADLNQVERLSKFVRVKKYRDGQIIRCKRAFLCFNLDIIDYVEAEEYYQMLHGDYVQIGVYPDKNTKVQKWVAVSEVVRDSYKSYTGAENVIVSYNPYTPVKPRKVLRLISRLALPTPAPGSIPVSLICSVQPSLLKLREAKASITIKKSGFISLVRADKRLETSIPV